ncbi:MAG: ComF family protein [Acidobacteria bacterium]|nr:ComF family protein [Acidobacteriota bacterium]
MFGKVCAPFLNLLFPEDCRVCGLPLKTFSRIPVCHGCLETPRPLESEFACATCGVPFANRFPLDEHGQCGLCRLGLAGFDSAYCFGSYEGALRELIHLFKYQGIRTLRRPLGAFLSQALPRERRYEVIVPVPMHWRKRWNRGFNQALLLARDLSRRTAIPVAAALRRTRAGEAQAGLTNAQRRASVRGVFSVTDRQAIDGRSVLLVDDVLTTGATAAACARALKRGGARHVTILTLARVDRRLTGLGGGAPTPPNTLVRGAA